VPDQTAVWPAIQLQEKLFLLLIFSLPGSGSSSSSFSLSLVALQFIFNFHLSIHRKKTIPIVDQVDRLLLAETELNKILSLSYPVSVIFIMFPTAAVAKSLLPVLL
jgi:hypothetical protein